MVNDPEWFGFGARTFALVQRILWLLPRLDTARVALLERGAPWPPEEPGELEDYGRMLSVVMPGHAIDEHRDEQPPEWVTRIHVPLATNPLAVMVVDGQPEHLPVGWAYLIDTRALHAIRNRGSTPRIHFMFDVRWR
jgi:aspartyl/asparaginyl beta-hydroxylase (cupin superfamily)